MLPKYVFQMSFYINTELLLERRQRVLGGERMEAYAIYIGKHKKNKWNFGFWIESGKNKLYQQRSLGTRRMRG